MREELFTESETFGGEPNHSGRRVGNLRWDNPAVAESDEVISDWQEVVVLLIHRPNSLTNPAILQECRWPASTLLILSARFHMAAMKLAGTLLFPDSFSSTVAAAAVSVLMIIRVVRAIQCLQRQCSGVID